MVDPQFLLTPPPGWLQYLFVLFLPADSFKIVLRIALIFNDYYPETGLDWSNINIVHEGVSVTVTWVMLLVNLLVMIGLLKYSGREKDEDALIKAKTNVNFDDESQQSLLLVGEEELVQKGEYEPVNIQSFNTDSS